jgi:hypothetical protein
MLYNPETGKRDKQAFNTVHSLLSKAGHLPTDYTLTRTLFGLHQLNDYSEIKRVCIVESEKTACIASIIFPSTPWMATGGKEFFKEEILQPVKNFPIVVYPDLDAHNEWETKSETFKDAGYKISVSDKLQDYDPLSPKDDLADFLLRIKPRPKQKDPEYALDGTLIHPEKGYPVSWDIITPTPLERMTQKNPHIKDLILKFDLVEIKKDTHGKII